MGVVEALCVGQKHLSSGGKRLSRNSSFYQSGRYGVEAFLRCYKLREIERSTEQDDRETKQDKCACDQLYRVERGPANLDRGWMTG
jgi:hypothetical protein